MNLRMSRYRLLGIGWVVSWREIVVVPHSSGSESIIMIVVLACGSYARRASVFGSAVNGRRRRGVESRYK